PRPPLHSYIHLLSPPLPSVPEGSRITRGHVREDRGGVREVGGGGRELALRRPLRLLELLPRGRLRAQVPAAVHLVPDDEPMRSQLVQIGINVAGGHVVVKRVQLPLPQLRVVHATP